MITFAGEMNETRKSRGYLSSVIDCRCPRCREGKLFKYPVSIRLKRNMMMNETCLVCGQATELEVGFYYGTGYVSYGVTVMLSLISLALWWILIGFSTSDNRFFYWIGFNSVLLILLQPWIMRFSRSLWISWFVRYDPDWKKNKPVDVSERLNPDQAGNW
jgi:hypothetical protein